MSGFGRLFWEGSAVCLTGPFAFICSSRWSCEAVGEGSWLGWLGLSVLLGDARGLSSWASPPPRKKILLAENLVKRRDFLPRSPSSAPDICRLMDSSTTRQQHYPRRHTSKLPRANGSLPFRHPPQVSLCRSSFKICCSAHRDMVLSSFTFLTYTSTDSASNMVIIAEDAPRASPAAYTASSS